MVELEANDNINIFEEEFERIAGKDKLYLLLQDVLKIMIVDSNDEITINFHHLRNY